MLVSYQWLKDYVNITDVSAIDLAEKITRSGIEVEGVEQKAKGLKGVVVGHVVECQQHPDADKLNICKVDIGEEEVKQIICGAPNVGKGQKVAVATVGAVLPGDFKIKKAKLRGETSEGMICSLKELGIEGKLIPKEYAEGIFVYPEDVSVGEDALASLNLFDEVLELGLTPNRADCLSMLGVAYEVGAILGREVTLPTIELKETTQPTSDAIKVTVEASEDNPYYGARVIKDVKIGPSPLWLQNRLVAAGIRPISNVVDVTNYILLEYGQPLHAFDLDKLGSNEIVVRKAKDGEKIVTLDDQERTLKADHLVITNGTAPVAIAGVMGGAESEVSNATVNVLLESAVFDSKSIRKTSKDHGLRSEASTRYEKGVDPVRAPMAADRAASLIAELAGGTVLNGLVEVNSLPKEQTTVEVSVQQINRVLGTSISEQEIEEIFNRLKFENKLNDGTFTVEVPSRRRDITIPEDLIEEVARIYGYDNLPTTLPIGTSKPGRLTPFQQKRRFVRRYLEGAGLLQTITYSLTSTEKATKFIDEDLKDYHAVRLHMPMSEERSMLRLSIIPHLLEVVAHNNARQIETVGIYEIGSIFLSNENKLTTLPKESERLAGAISGLWHEHQWQGEKKKVDFFVLKGILEGLFNGLGLSNRITFVQAKKNGLHPGRTADILLDNQKIGFIGQVHPEEQKELDIEETYVFEISLEKVFHTDVDAIVYSPIPRYPSITRDIALVVNKETSAGDIKSVIVEAGGKLLKEIAIFDVYEGEHMEEGKKSIAFKLNYYNPEKTLTDEEVQKAHSRVLSAVDEKLGAKLRG